MRSSRTVTLRSGGTVTLELDAKVLQLPASDFELVRSLVATLDAYERCQSVEPDDDVPPLVRPATPDTPPSPVELPKRAKRAPVKTASGRAAKLGAERLQLVADVATQALAEYRDPGPAVAEALGVKPGSASVYMAKARDAGYDIPTERPCRHCGTSYRLMGIVTHERSCLQQPGPPTRPPGKRRASKRAAPAELDARVAAEAKTVAVNKTASRRLNDEIDELRARDRAEAAAKGRSEISEISDSDRDEPRPGLVWTCADCGLTCRRKLDLQRHISDAHDRHSLRAHEEIGAVA